MKHNLQKRIALFLGVTMLFLCVAGCAGSTVPEPTMETVDPSLWPKVEKDYSAAPVLEADPERKVYFSLQNQDCDFYPGAPYNGVFFFIITKDAYSAEQIQVDFPGETRCAVRVRDYNSAFQNISLNTQTGSYAPDGQQPYHYLCLQKVDLQALAQKQSDASHAGAAYHALVRKNTASEEDYKTLMEGYVLPFQTLYQEYIDRYAAQPVGSLTNYHAYRVNLMFEPQYYAEETVRHVDVTLGGSTHRVEFGQWRFHSEDWPGADQTPKGVRLQTVGVVGVSDDSPYAQGYLRTPDALRFQAEEDIVLTGLRCSDGTAATVLGAKIVSKSADGSMDYFWDGSGPVQVKAGAGVTASVYLYSEKFKEYEMNMTTVIYVDYILAATGEKGALAMPCNFPRANNIWDTYCLAFLGVDVGEYYHYFKHEILGTHWLDEIPEGWRKE